MLIDQYKACNTIEEIKEVQATLNENQDLREKADGDYASRDWLIENPNRQYELDEVNHPDDRSDG
ncbi:hypothetical protein FRC17_001522 [Serendipita sp. 399]|nr:hypothetical protein FRC17_001522 [Serendipita sp. 399]